MCPVKTATHFAAATSQIRTVRSALAAKPADARQQLNADGANTAPDDPSTGPIAASVRMSQRSICVPSLTGTRQAVVRLDCRPARFLSHRATRIKGVDCRAGRGVDDARVLPSASAAAIVAPSGTHCDRLDHRRSPGP